MRAYLFLETNENRKPFCRDDAVCVWGGVFACVVMGNS